jgi:branched-chain amino acid transport system substrate-binding protein
VRRAALALVCVAAVATACTSAPDPIVVGAIYPITGSQGPGGLHEFRGVQLAADMVNAQGGVGGRAIRLEPVDVPAAAAAAPAVQALHRQGVRYVVGSYGSTISWPASAQADRDGMLYWETGAVGMMPPQGQGTLVFRVPPTGAVLGGSAIDFVAQELAPRLHRNPTRLRFAVVNVGDAYGTEVARGAIDAIHRLGLPYAGDVTYDPNHVDPARVVRRIRALRPDVLFVSAYVQDGVAVRREMVAQHLHLVAAIGSSSSYCMVEFGRELGTDAVGLFASDKPDAWSLNPKGLSAPAAALLRDANERYEDRYHTYMDAPALAGFSAAWALFHDVMPSASALTPASVGAAALRTRLPQGSLPNGSGLAFAAAGTPDAGANVRALGVIWEWQAPGRRVVVWPPIFARAPVRVLPLAT